MTKKAPWKDDMYKFIQHTDLSNLQEEINNLADEFDLINILYIGISSMFMATLKRKAPENELDYIFKDIDFESKVYPKFKPKPIEEVLDKSDDKISTAFFTKMKNLICQNEALKEENKALKEIIRELKEINNEISIVTKAIRISTDKIHNEILQNLGKKQ